MKSDGRFNRADLDDGEESESNWQDSYSDLMTDLLAIFVVLFSFAMMSQAVAANRTASGQKPDMVYEVSASEDPSDEDLLPSGPDNAISGQDGAEGLVKSIGIYIEEAKLSEHLSVGKNGNGQILLRVASSALFNSGQADILPEAEPLLDRISEILDEFSSSILMVRIEGHTDNVPISSKHFASNWELSTSRAVNVLRRLIETSGLATDRFSAVGYSEFHPVAPNDTAASRAKNRRVDFIIETSRVIELKRSI